MLETPLKVGINDESMNDCLLRLTINSQGNIEIIKPLRNDFFPPEIGFNNAILKLDLLVHSGLHTMRLKVMGFCNWNLNI